MTKSQRLAEHLTACTRIVEAGHCLQTYGVFCGNSTMKKRARSVGKVECPGPWDRKDCPLGWSCKNAFESAQRFLKEHTDEKRAD